MMTESTITPEQGQEIAGLPDGASATEERLRSAIDLVLKGRHDDEIPGCMSEMIGCLLRYIGVSVPPEFWQDDPRWRELLFLAVDTGRELEAERLQLIVSWMWDVLASPVVVAGAPDKVKTTWADMLEERTAESAWAARRTAYAASAAAYAARSARPSAQTTKAAEAAAYVARVSWAAAAAVDTIVLSARSPRIYPPCCHVVPRAIGAVWSTAILARAAGLNLWPDIDPVGLLERLIKIGPNND